MEDKVYVVKGGNRLVSIILGLVFVAAGVLLIVMGKDWRGVFLVLPGAVVLWFGLRPNKLIFTADAVVDQAGSTRRFGYSQITKVRMVARKFMKGAKRSVGVQYGPVKVNKAVDGTGYYRVYPEIQIEGDFPAPLIVEIPYSGPAIGEDGKPMEGRGRRTRRGSRYDTQAVLRDLLDRIPASVEVDSTVQSYVATGELPDVTTLPQENVKIPLPFGGQS